MITFFQALLSSIQTKIKIMKWVFYSPRSLCWTNISPILTVNDFSRKLEILQINYKSLNLPLKMDERNIYIWHTKKNEWCITETHNKHLFWKYAPLCYGSEGFISPLSNSDIILGHINGLQIWNNESVYRFIQGK